MTPTREEVESEPAGLRLDAWVSEAVMGWRPGGSALWRDADGNYYFAGGGPVADGPTR
jgi:hypothetical protein